MTRQQFNKTIETVINSPRNNLQMINMLQNAFALYVQEETNRIVEQLEEFKTIAAKQDNCRAKNDKEECTGRDCFECVLNDAIEIVKAGVD